MAADPDHRGWAQIRRHRREQRQPWDGRYDRHGEDDRMPHRSPALRARGLNWSFASPRPKGAVGLTQKAWEMAQCWQQPAPFLVKIMAARRPK